MNALARRLGCLVRRIRASRDLRRALHRECQVTKADLRRAIIRTAALAHFHHHFGGRVLRSAINDNLPSGRAEGFGAASGQGVPGRAAPDLVCSFHGAEV